MFSLETMFRGVIVATAMHMVDHIDLSNTHHHDHNTDGIGS